MLEMHDSILVVPPPPSPGTPWSGTTVKYSQQTGNLLQPGSSISVFDVWKRVQPNPSAFVRLGNKNTKPELIIWEDCI